jgi:hypothetical protein
LQFVTLTQLSQPVATPVGVTTSFAFAKWHRGKTRLPDLLVARDVLLAMPARLSSREGVASIRLPADIVNSAQRALLALLEVVGACLAPQPRFSLVITVQNFLTPLAVPFGTPPHGFGSCAVAVIPAGTSVATFGGTAMTRVEFAKFEAERQSRSLQVNTNLIFLGPPSREPGDSINHSCEPNCGMRNATTIVAMRDIAVGEELTFDYAMSDASDYDEFDCNCGTALCRGRVRADDWQLETLRHRYTGFFSPYIQRKIYAERHRALLTKRDVETLLATYDTQPERALSAALRKCLGMPHASWETLIECAVVQPEEAHSLVLRNTDALDSLAKRLNETRGAGL